MCNYLKKRRYVAYLKGLYNPETGKQLHEVSLINAFLNFVLMLKNIWIFEGLIKQTEVVYRFQ